MDKKKIRLSSKYFPPAKEQKPYDRYYELLQLCRKIIAEKEAEIENIKQEAENKIATLKEQIKTHENQISHLEKQRQLTSTTTK